MRELRGVAAHLPEDMGHPSEPSWFKASHGKRKQAKGQVQMSKAKKNEQTRASANTNREVDDQSNKPRTMHKHKPYRIMKEPSKSKELEVAKAQRIKTRVDFQEAQMSVNYFLAIWSSDIPQSSGREHNSGRGSRGKAMDTSN
ncbi:hypothetical protein K1719_029126 [Acacia pycnantha]|nr:hypothetical protein K1719_029126 [Acacia pycnantha]